MLKKMVGVVALMSASLLMVGCQEQASGEGEKSSTEKTKISQKSSESSSESKQKPEVGSLNVFSKDKYFPFKISEITGYEVPKNLKEIVGAYEGKAGLDEQSFYELVINPDGSYTMMEYFTQRTKVDCTLAYFDKEGNTQYLDWDPGLGKLSSGVVGYEYGRPKLYEIQCLIAEMVVDENGETKMNAKAGGIETDYIDKKQGVNPLINQDESESRLALKDGQLIMKEEVKESFPLEKVDKEKLIYANRSVSQTIYDLQKSKNIRQGALPISSPNELLIAVSTNDEARKDIPIKTVDPSEADKGYLEDNSKITTDNCILINDTYYATDSKNKRRIYTGRKDSESGEIRWRIKNESSLAEKELPIFLEEEKTGKK